VRTKRRSRLAAAAAAMIGVSTFGLIGPGAIAQTDPAVVSNQYAPSVFEVTSQYCNGLPRGTGTAFVIGPRKLLTNAHVIGVADPIVGLKNRDGRVLTGRVTQFGGDDWDLAIIETDEDLPVALNFADPAALVEGQAITVLGFPRGRYSVSSGILNSFEADPSIPARSVGRTDAAVDSGNSGGPAITTNGEVVGVVSAVDLSGITRPGLFLTREAYNAAFAAPVGRSADWCRIGRPLSAGQLSTGALGFRTVTRRGFSAQLPLNLLTEVDESDPTSPEWSTKDGWFSVYIFELPDGLTPRQSEIDLVDYYTRPSISFGSPVVRLRTFDMAIALKDGTRRRISYRFGRGTGWGMIIDYVPEGPGVERVVAKISAGFKSR
jgi:Trypsin-like peptidase domain